MCSAAARSQMGNGSAYAAGADSASGDLVVVNAAGAKTALRAKSPDAPSLNSYGPLR